MKAAVGTMPVIYRVSVDDYFPQGIGLDEGTQIAVWAAEAGADALHIAAGHYRSLPSGERMIPPMAYPDATFLDYAAEVKQRGQRAGDRGRPARRSGARDGGGRERQGRFRRARPHADRRSGMGREAARGEPARRCLACNTCVNEMRGGAQLRCVVNGAAGQETALRSPRGRRRASASR